MKCKEKDCGGEVEISSDKVVSLQTGCSGRGGSRTDAYPCNKCGRVHYDDGSLVTTRGGAKVFLIDEKVVKKTIYPNRLPSEQVVIEPISI